MLKQLDISNYAIIERVSVSFNKGFTVITGETGAGKSIILGALGLILGKRADTSVLNDNSQKCVVEAHFDIYGYGLESIFESEDMDYDDHTIIRREISTSGKSRAFVNDTPVTLNTLKEITERVINLHQQFDLLDIQKKSFQLEMLDAYAQTQSKVIEYKTAYHSIQKLKSELVQLNDESKRMSKESDFLRFQHEELSKINLADINQVELETELNVLNNAEGIRTAGSAAVFSISESDNSILDQLQGISKELSSYISVDKKIEELDSKIIDNIELLKDISFEIQGYIDKIDGDDGRKAELDELLSELYKLLNKYHAANLEDLIAQKNEIELKLQRTDSMDEQIAQLEKQINAATKQCKQIALDISKSRKEAIPTLENKVSLLLHDLGMPKSKLVIKQDILPEISKNGIDVIEYYFAPNLGSEAKPLKDTASGGEISRLTLCLKSVVAAVINLPTMIFDEIDTGVSGGVSLKMGNIMKDMAQGKQVISITHSAQIASRADDHLFIFKQIVDEKTRTQIRALETNERIQELAKILSGDPPSQSAVSNAQELINM